MLISGVLSGIAGAIEVLGVHYRLIEGFSLGFGFNAIAIALLATLKPLWVDPGRAVLRVPGNRRARRCSARSAFRPRWCS